jgi:1,4-dihydroxy-2-naphthoyl-CoA hydrolase
VKVTMRSDGEAEGSGAGAAEAAAAGVPLLGRWVAEAGFEVDEASGSRVVGHIDVGADHHTPHGIVHGGLYATVIESAASIGASVAAAEGGHYAVGLNNSTDFLRGTEKGRLDVVAEPVIQGRTQQLWDVTITRATDGKPVARGRVRLQNVPLPG